MKSYLPGLNTIRLFAALSVVIDHALPYAEPQASLAIPLKLLFLGGYNAVTVFFTLSGFLITYLLLSEQNRFATISVKHFYQRRALRIWPLYFIVLVLSVAIFPSRMPDSQAILAILLFSPHMVMNLGILGHYWSIGVEEWFYAVWPIVMKVMKNLPMILGAIILIRLLLALSVSTEFAVMITGADGRYDGYMTLIFKSLRFECMAIGALGAWVLFYKHWTLKLIYRLQLLFAVLAILFIVLRIGGGVVTDSLIAFAWMGLMVNVSTNPKSTLKLEHPILSSLGQATYGVYLYHVLVMTLVYETGLRGMMYLIVVVLVTLLIAIASYRWIESPILKLKAYGKPTPVIATDEKAVQASHM